MDVKNNSKKGFSCLEFTVAMTFLIPFIFYMMLIIQHFRMHYRFEDALTNEFGNRKDFILKLDDKFKVTSKSESELKDLISQKISNLEKQKWLQAATFTSELKEVNDNKENFRKDERLNKKYYVIINGILDMSKVSKSFDILNLMPKEIKIEKKLLVTYEFD